MKQTSHDPDRRPIASRRLAWVQSTATWLVRRNISPNVISMASIVFALAGAAAMLGTNHFNGMGQRMLWLTVAACILLRLLANLFDGMVAVESAGCSPLGELFNEVPDRVSDVMLLVGLGFVPGSSVQLGYAAAILAVFVAYIRAIGGQVGAGQVFAGMMSKPKRMFLIIVLCMFETLAPVEWKASSMAFGLKAPALVLAVICAGCLITSFTRLRTVFSKLRLAG